jgi:hemerythrin
MEMIEWKDEYNVGIHLIDTQHQTLIKLINRLTQEREQDGMVSYVIDDLNLYVKEHFKEEEELMRLAKYEGFSAHKEEHRVFEKWLSAVCQVLNLGGNSSHLLAESVNAFLRNWLVNHILESDMSYRSSLIGISEKI